MDAVKLQNYRSFLDRLGDAMRQHIKNLDAARAEYEKRRRLQWSEKRIEAESLGRAVERFRTEERAAEEREQREGDDAAMRMSLSRGQSVALRPSGNP